MFVLTQAVGACASTFSLPKTTKSGAISQESYAKMLGPASLSGVVAGWRYGLPLYSSFSVYRGNKPWTGDPTKEIASHTSNNVTIRILADNASPAWVEVANSFSNDFTEKLSVQIDRTWKNGKRRIYAINLLMYPPLTKINRIYHRIFFGKTFHVRFYFPLYNAKTPYETGEMRSIANSLAHEYYHLRVGPLGGANAKPARKDLSKTQQHILGEAGGAFFGSCLELKVSGRIEKRRGIMYSKIDPSTGKIRTGTLSDKMILSALAPGTKVKPNDLVAFGPMLFATFWAEAAGPVPYINEGDEAANKMQNICDNALAHPTDLWPIFWELANDGKDAPEFEQSKPAKSI